MLSLVTESAKNGTSEKGRLGLFSYFCTKFTNTSNMKKKTILMMAALALSSLSTQAQQYPWQNTNLSNTDRVENLIGMLTPEEKVGLMMNKSISIDRLGIPSYNWWSEACHGVRQGDYTVYPQPIGMAAAFNAQLVRDVFSQVSDEARANWNRSDHSVQHVEMSCSRKLFLRVYWAFRILFSGPLSRRLVYNTTYLGKCQGFSM